MGSKPFHFDSENNNGKNVQPQIFYGTNIVKKIFTVNEPAALPLILLHLYTVFSFCIITVKMYYLEIYFKFINLEIILKQSHLSVSWSTVGGLKFLIRDDKNIVQQKGSRVL